MKISVVVPAHNETNYVRQVVRSCREFCDEVIVVDDGSTDDTSRVSREAGATVIRNAKNLGIVRSTQIGIRAALGDIIVALDADGQHDPAEIPRLVRPIRQGSADFVLGSRDGGLSVSERALSLLVSARVRCRDASTGFRAIRGNLAKKLRLRGFCLCGSLILEARDYGARIVEVTTNAQSRIYGESHFAKSRTNTHCKQVSVILYFLLPKSIRQLRVSHRFHSEMSPD